MVWDGEGDHDYDRGEDGDHDEETQTFSMHVASLDRGNYVPPGCSRCFKGGGCGRDP